MVKEKTGNMEVAVAIWRMSRPLVLLSTALSWFLGTSIALGSGSQLNISSIILGFTSMILVAASIHLVNEYVDYETDALTNRSMYSGGSGVLPSGAVPRSLAMKSALATGILGIIVEAVSITMGFHTSLALIILVTGLIGGWMYSHPPFKLAWKGLGELDNSLLGALLLPIFGYVSVSGSLDSWVIPTLIPFTLLAFNNLLAVTWPDREADGAVGKNTLAVLWDPGALRVLHWGVYASSVIIMAYYSGLLFPLPVVIVSIPCYILAFYGGLTYTRVEVSVGSIWGMTFMMVLQSLAWLWYGGFIPV